MNTYTQEELAVIIEKHGKWLNDEEGGERANLRGANMYGANLYGANMYGANLHGADLLCLGNMESIKTIQADIWQIGYTHDTMQIGCQRHLIDEWWKFSDEEISRMDSQALAWWKVWKPILRKIIKVSPAEPTGYVESKE